MKFCYPPPTSYPEAEMQCVIDCMNGVCTESDADKQWCHYVAASWAMREGLAAAQNQSKAPVTVKDVEALHQAYKTGKKMAAPFNWLALVQLLIAAAGPIIQAILNLLNPQPTPAP